jgi:integrase
MNSRKIIDPEYLAETAANKENENMGKKHKRIEGIIPNGRKGTQDISASGGRKKIVYVDGLGIDPDTREFVAHFRLGNNTYTRPTGKKSLDEARKVLKNMKADLRNYAESGVIPGLTFKEGFNIWVAKAPNEFNRKRKPQAARIEKMIGFWDNWVIPFIGHISIEIAGRDLLFDCVKRYEENSGPYAPHRMGGVRNVIINLNTPIRFLKRQGFIQKHPDLPVIPEMDAPKIHYVKPDRLLDLMELFDRYVGYDIYSMIYIRTMGFTGLRTENARSLRKEYFNLEDRTFNTGKTKNGKSYILPVPGDLIEMLRRVPGIETPGPLFNDPHNKGIRGYHWCLALFKRACLALGLPDTRAWHTLRASYATFLIRSNVDLLIVKDLMVHETLVMILRYAANDKADLAVGQAKGMDFLRMAQEQRRIAKQVVD